MNPLAHAAAFTGLPAKKPTRRGRGKGKAKGSPATHVANLNSAHKAGDHAAVKSHAFALIRSLPSQADPMDSPPSAGGAIPPAASAASPPAVSSPPQMQPQGGGLSKLAGLLTSRKTR